jgi:hypothetical protein
VKHADIYPPHPWTSRKISKKISKKKLNSERQSGSNILRTVFGASEGNI